MAGAPVGEGTARLPRLQVLAIGVAVAATVGALVMAFGALGIALSLAAAAPAVAAPLAFARRRSGHAEAAPRLAVDLTLVRAALDLFEEPAALTNAAGSLRACNAAYVATYGDADPSTVLTSSPDLASLIGEALSEGRAERNLTLSNGTGTNVMCFRTDGVERHLAWRLRAIKREQDAPRLRQVLGGDWGERLGEAGVMAALIDAEGNVLSANRALLLRAGVDGQAVANLVELLAVDINGLLRFAIDGLGGQPVRMVQIPIDPAARHTARVVLFLDEVLVPISGDGDDALHTLLSMLPVGLALADRDGRFLYVNQAFMRAAGVPAGSMPLYPSDLVIAEDKPAVADAVRRYALGRSSQGDIAVRLKDRPEEPIALTIAGARGLGEAAVLLSLRDNSEESRLKREVAQATKMQAVGQLAGGVAHDFNNILTGIIGHCDLMLMRHAPGDSDYDDIQQIRLNSNRAAGLTRQLLAFSRQQTLRPQVLQLPDVVSEVSNLLKRLLGETVELQIKHGRGMGPVRADPGQLEQVIVNLAVNARDAMPEGGTLTLETYPIAASEVRSLGSDVLPIADYIALRMTDTGEGIPAEVVSKIFEPFFTTKEVGKGTGLGLSTVYGIVKQSGGFIFAESEEGRGASFVIYLPVHSGAIEQPMVVVPGSKPVELWGTGDILLVEDEDMVRAVAERALTRHGYSVTTAANGEEALEKLSGGLTVDLLISDVVMPVMDGPTLVRRARQDHPNMRILFMSGYAEEQLRRSIDIERVHFLAKPFSVKQLAEATQVAFAAPVDQALAAR